MSLLALLADNFELEPHRDDEHLRPVTGQLNSSLDNDLASSSSDCDRFDESKELAEPLLLEENEHIAREEKDDTKLLLSFFLMLFVGTLNKIFQKLQAIVSTLLCVLCSIEPNLQMNMTNQNRYIYIRIIFLSLCGSQCTTIPTASTSSKTLSTSHFASSTSCPFPTMDCLTMPSLTRSQP